MTRRAAVAVTLLAVVMMSACGDASSDSGAAPAEPTTTAAAADTTAAPATTTTTTTEASTSSQADTTTTEAAPEESTTTTAGSVGDCDHQYMPIRQGSKWIYETPEDILVEWEITSVSGDGREATMETEFASPEGVIEVTVNFTCDESGVSAPELGMVGLPFGAEVSIVEQEGVYLLPAAELVPGATWDSVLVIAAEFPDAPGFEFEIVRETTFTVEGTEEVTVPAGTFTALKVRSDSDMEISTGAAPIQSQGVEWLWFVEGIGLVKEELELDGGVAFSNLAEFFIP